MRHTNGTGATLNKGAHSFMQAVEVVPSDAGLQRIDQDAIIVQVLAHVWFGVAGMFPFACGITCKVHGTVSAGDLLDLARHQAGVVLIAFDIAQTQTALHWLESAEGKDRLQKIRHAV